MSSDSAENEPSETPFERASRLGLIGCVIHDDADLSTNPRHMEGFGESPCKPDDRASP